MANKQETGLTVTTPVSEAINHLNEKLKSVKKIVETPYKTSKKITTASGVKDISEETNEVELVKAISSVVGRIDHIEKTYEMLGETTYPVVKIDGGTKEEWIHDGQLRIQVIRQKETYDKLNNLKKKWEALMDKEDQKALLIEEMKTI